MNSTVAPTREPYVVQSCTACNSIVLTKHLYRCAKCGHATCKFCGYKQGRQGIICEACYKTLSEDQRLAYSQNSRGGLTRKRALAVLVLGIIILVFVLQPFGDFLIALFSGTFDSYAFSYALPAIILVVVGAILVKLAPKSSKK